MSHPFCLKRLSHAIQLQVRSTFFKLIGSTKASTYGLGEMYIVAMLVELTPREYTMSDGVWGMGIQAAAAFIGHGMGGVVVTQSGRCNWQHL
jgi:hypothetical protein